MSIQNGIDENLGWASRLVLDSGENSY